MNDIKQGRFEATDAGLMVVQLYKAYPLTLILVENTFIGEV